MQINKDSQGKKVLILYWSATGNTEKVAVSIKNALTREGVESGNQENYRRDA